MWFTMPTDNPKVSAYVPEAVKNRLTQFREEQGNISESQAVILILSEYFGIEQIVKTQSIGGVTPRRIETIESRLDQLEELEKTVRELQDRISSLLGEPPEKVTIPIEDSSQLSLLDIQCQSNETKILMKGLTHKDLSKRVDIPSSTLRRWRNGDKDKFASETAKQDPEGIQWYYNESVKRYFPIN